MVRRSSFGFLCLCMTPNIGPGPDPSAVLKQLNVARNVAWKLVAICRRWRQGLRLPDDAVDSDLALPRARARRSFSLAGTSRTRDPGRFFPS